MLEIIIAMENEAGEMCFFYFVKVKGVFMWKQYLLGKIYSYIYVWII